MGSVVQGQGVKAALNLLTTQQSCVAGQDALCRLAFCTSSQLPPVGVCKRLPDNGHVCPIPWQVLACPAGAGKKAVRAAAKPGEGVAMGAWCNGKDLYVTKKLRESN